ncbi:MAG: substrate-binding domain-containing protein [Planctomycetaceae bacterium]
MSAPIISRRQMLHRWAILGLLACGLSACSKAPEPNTPTTSEQPAAASTPSTGGPAAQPKRIIMLVNGDDPFWDAMYRGMEKAEQDLKLVDAGYKVAMDKPDFTEDAQINKLKQYASQTDIAAVAISPVNATNQAIAEGMRELRKKGIPVFCIDSDMGTEFRDTRVAYLGTNNRAAGAELGKCAKGLVEKGQYATFVGKDDVMNAIQRIGGFGDGAGASFECKTSLTDQADLSLAQENVKTALNNFPELNCLVGIWAYNAHAISQVVKDRGVREKTKVLVFDAAQAAIEDMEAGGIDAMVVQNPYQMGYLGTELMKAYLEKDYATFQKTYPSYDPESKTFKEENGDVYATELRVVVPDENSPVKKEMFNPDTKFFYLKDFKAWLAERGLVNS